MFVIADYINISVLHSSSGSRLKTMLSSPSTITLRLCRWILNPTLLKSGMQLLDQWSSKEHWKGNNRVRRTHCWREKLCHCRSGFWRSWVIKESFQEIDRFATEQQLLWSRSSLVTVSNKIIYNHNLSNIYRSTYNFFLITHIYLYTFIKYCSS